MAIPLFGVTMEALILKHVRISLVSNEEHKDKENKDFKDKYVGCHESALFD